MRHLFSTFLALVIAGTPVVASAQSVSVVVNGQRMHFRQPPIMRAGRVFVPLRGIFERLGAGVVYANGHIDAKGRGRTVSLTIGSTEAYINGAPEILDVPPFIVAETTYVPLRFISLAMSASVNWNDSTYTVTIIALPVGRHGGLVPPRTR
jgi:spore germination protein